METAKGGYYLNRQGFPMDANGNLLNTKGALANTAPPLPLTDVIGIGPARANDLKTNGITTTAQLAAMESDDLSNLLAISNEQAQTIITNAEKLTV